MLARGPGAIGLWIYLQLEFTRAMWEYKSVTTITDCVHHR